MDASKLELATALGERDELLGLMREIITATNQISLTKAIRSGQECYATLPPFSKHSAKGANNWPSWSKSSKNQVFSTTNSE